jgi:putative transposase
LEGRLICEARIVKARGYRPLSFYEMAMEKRADAAISRHEVHIAEIERQRTVQTLTHESAPILQGFNPVISEQYQPRMVQGELLEAEAVELTAPAPKEPKTTTEWTVPTTPDARWPLWVATHAQVEAGIKIDNPPLLKWLDTYQMTSEYRSFAQRSEQR